MTSTKELKHCLSDGGFKAAGLLGVAYCMGTNKPTLTPTLKNFAIITGIIATGDYIYDYGKTEKWWPWL